MNAQEQLGRIRLASLVMVEIYREVDEANHSNLIRELLRYHPYAAAIGLTDSLPVLRLDENGAVLRYLAQTIDTSLSDSILRQARSKVPEASSGSRFLVKKLAMEMSAALESFENECSRAFLEDFVPDRRALVDEICDSILRCSGYDWNIAFSAAVVITLPVDGSLRRTILNQVRSSIRTRKGAWRRVSRGIKRGLFLDRSLSRDSLAAALTKKEFSIALMRWCCNERALFYAIVRHETSATWRSFVLQSRWASEGVVRAALSALGSPTTPKQVRDAIAEWLCRVRVVAPMTGERPHSDDRLLGTHVKVIDNYAKPLESEVVTSSFDSKKLKYYSQDQAYRFPRVARLSRRVYATLLDALIISPLILSVSYFLIAVFDLQGPAGVLLCVGIALFTWLSYMLAFAIRGLETWGLRCFHLVTIGFDGLLPTTTQRVLRAVSEVLSAGSAGMGYLWIFGDQEELGWHDHISQTFLAEEIEW